MLRDFKVWDQVPDGSCLLLRIDPGPFLSSARVTRAVAGEALADTILSHAELTRGAAVEIDASVDYTVRVRVHIPAIPIRTVVRAWIETPGGAPFKTAFEYPLAGARGDVLRATLVASTGTIDLEHESPPVLAG